MAHIEHTVIDDDKKFIIDGNTRKITNLTNSNPSIMQFDHNSEELSFQVPRIIEGHDMMQCDELQIIFKNTGAGVGIPKGTFSAGTEVITNRVLNEAENVINFSWKIPEKATKYPGPLTFQFKFICYDNNEETYRLLTDQFAFITILPSVDISKA